MDSYPSLTQLRTFTGTPGYLSPQVTSSPAPTAEAQNDRRFRSRHTSRGTTAAD